MNVEQFCIALKGKGYDHVTLAISVLWYLDNDAPGSARAPGELAKIIRDSGLANPHSTRLGEALNKSGYVLRQGKRFKLKPIFRSEFNEKFSQIVKAPSVEIDQSHGFLVSGVWQGSRGYIETIAKQLNGCYQCEFYDCAAVLSRRLLESLLIEVCEVKGIGHLIQQSDGNYMQLKGILKVVISQNMIKLSRNARQGVEKVKALGDLSAHSRYATVKKAELDKLSHEFRVAVEELIKIANLI